MSLIPIGDNNDGAKLQEAFARYILAYTHFTPKSHLSMATPFVGIEVVIAMDLYLYRSGVESALRRLEYITQKQSEGERKFTAQEKLTVKSTKLPQTPLVPISSNDGYKLSTCIALYSCHYCMRHKKNMDVRCGLWGSEMVNLLYLYKNHGLMPTLQALDEITKDVQPRGKKFGCLSFMKA